MQDTDLNLSNTVKHSLDYLRCEWRGGPVAAMLLPENDRRVNDQSETYRNQDSE
jgi:hypothetical protein